MKNTYTIADYIAWNERMLDEFEAQGDKTSVSYIKKEIKRLKSNMPLKTRAEETIEDESLSPQIEAFEWQE